MKSDIFYFYFRPSKCEAKNFLQNKLKAKQVKISAFNFLFQLMVGCGYVSWLDVSLDLKTTCK